MKLAPGLHRIGNDIVAFHLIETPEGVTLIDAGLPGHWGELRAELAAMGRTLDDVRGVVLTHGDMDHRGVAERLRREHGVPVYVHEADAARAKGAKPPASAPDPHRRVGPLLAFGWYALRRGAARASQLTEVVEVHDGDVLDLPATPRIVGLPGHSPGSIAVHVPAVSALFVGDGLTTRNVLTGDVGAAAAPFTDDPELARASLKRLKGLDAKWILPGHGAPYSGGVAALLSDLGSA